MERNAIKGLCEMVMELNEKVDSSLGTALTSRPITSGPDSGERINLAREREVLRKMVECSEINFTVN